MVFVFIFVSLVTNCDTKHIYAPNIKEQIDQSLDFIRVAIYFTIRTEQLYNIKVKKTKNREITQIRKQ